MGDAEDSVMARVRELLEKSGMSNQELGQKMGYTDGIARKSVWQFLKSKDPRIGMLRRFAAAIGVTIEELVSEKPIRPRRSKK